MTKTRPLTTYPNPAVTGLADQFYTVSKSEWTPLIPAIVNACLAIELYLKSLSARDAYHNPRQQSSASIEGNQVPVFGGNIVTDSVRGHVFTDLIDELPEIPTKHLAIALDTKVSMTIEDFKNKLAPFDKAFIAFRYAHEMPSQEIDWQGLKEARELVHETIRAIRGYGSIDGQYFDI